mgnify:CR=1 FL=1
MYNKYYKYMYNDSYTNGLKWYICIVVRVAELLNKFKMIINLQKKMDNGILSRTRLLNNHYSLFAQFMSVFSDSFILHFNTTLIIMNNEAQSQR